MSTRKEALQELLAKVEAGDDAGFRRSNRAVFATPCQDIALQLREEHCRHAYKGSLDAAKALHEAVLPGCSQYSIVTDPTCLKVSVCWWPDGLSGKREVHGEGWSEADPARAWLIAIIKALIAQEARG
tara:strand:+ start:51727 stop:52110 length:384 start_codon:yes stop_codon:yes gene_type:complete